MARMVRLLKESSTNYSSMPMRLSSCPSPCEPSSLWFSLAGSAPPSPSRRKSTWASIRSSPCLRIPTCWTTLRYPWRQTKLFVSVYNFSCSPFQYLSNYLAVGAPVYFVVRENDMDYSSQAVQRKLCGGLGCDTDSLVTQVYLASKSKNRSYIAATPASWIDDYLDWFRIGPCCQVDSETGEFCPASNPGTTSVMSSFSCCTFVISLSFRSGFFCEPCNKTFTDEENLWPDAKTFRHWLPTFLKDNPCQDCPKGGHAAYGQVTDQEIERNWSQITPDSFCHLDRVWFSMDWRVT